VDDVSNFHTKFTSEKLMLTQAQDPRPIHGVDQQHFEGFDCVNRWEIGRC
jgi:hypothetical protein